MPLAKRFIQTYMENPPGITPHEIHVAINGGVELGEWCRRLFSPLPCRFFQHNNFGMDIGAYQSAADTIDCDLMVCLGSPIHFHKPGWLDRIVMAYEENGPTVYAPWGFQHPNPHLRTTAFWLPPELLNSYPKRVGNADRYAFEHGPESISLWAKKQGFDPLMVTWRGVYPLEAWQPVTRDESLFIDQHMEKNLTQ